MEQLITKKRMQPTNTKGAQDDTRQGVKGYPLGIEQEIDY